MTIQEIYWQDAIPIRHQVLWPQKSPEFCQLDGDETATHYGGFVEGKLVSVASIYVDGEKARLRKFATLKQYQGRGVGTQLITHAIATLKRQGIEYFWCDARASAVGYYERFGMTPFGDEFDKSGVRYFKMFVVLS